MSKETLQQAKPVHVLIVNDDQEITDDCEEIFVKKGCKVSQFPSYELLIEAIQGNPELLGGIDVIIADNRIPYGMFGVDAVKTLRDGVFYKGIVIAYSGTRDNETINKFMENGANDFVPVQEGRDALLRKIQELLSQTLDK